MNILKPLLKIAISLTLIAIVLHAFDVKDVVSGYSVKNIAANADSLAAQEPDRS